MSVRSAVEFACLALLAGACKTSAVHDARPARVIDPSGESHAELQRVVSDMLFGAPVTLAEDALTDSSVLFIEHSRARSLENPPLSGRDMSQPQRFKLLTDGSRCILVHEEDQARYELLETRCVAE